MNLSKYAGYFHDGDLVDIIQNEDSIEFILLSADVPDEIFENPSGGIPISPDHRIKGKLIISGITQIVVDGKPFLGRLRMGYDDGDIFDLNIDKDSVQLQVIYSNFLPKWTEMAFTTIRITGKKIQWIAIPDLMNPLLLTEPPPGCSGHRVGPHCHLLNPNATNRNNKYLDKNGLPTSQGSKSSRLKPPERYSGNAYPADTSPLVEGTIKVIKYSGYFHDGSLVGLSHVEDHLSLTLISAEINEKDRMGDIPLTDDHRLKGILKFDGIQNMLVNGREFAKKLKMESEIADIFNLEIFDHRFDINLTWETYVPSQRKVKQQIISADFRQVSWENNHELDI